MIQVKDLTIDNFKILIKDTVKETIEQTLNEYLEDSDFNKTIKEEVKKRLIESQQKTKAGEKGTPLNEVIKKLNIVQ